MFVHLHVHGPFSFLDGGSSMEELLKQAAGFEMPALALTDHNCLSGAVRFQKPLRQPASRLSQGGRSPWKMIAISPSWPETRADMPHCAGWSAKPIWITREGLGRIWQHFPP